MYQKVVIVGHLGNDPEMRYTASGAPVVHFPVATNRKWTDSEGNVQEETTWFRVTVWGRQAETCNQFLEKGRLVLCEGEIRTSQFTDQQGVNRSSWELRALAVKFLGGPGERGPVPAFSGQAAQGGEAPGLAEDDIPF
jgi:single-strand DNA-binding protein